MVVLSAALSSISLILLLCFLPPINGKQCSPTKFSCGTTTLDLDYHFFTNTTDCDGVYRIQCINLTPVIQFPGEVQTFYYQVIEISYVDRSIVVHDIKLSINQYPWSGCAFMYQFSNPIARFNVTQASLLISPGQEFVFDCHSVHSGRRNLFDSMYRTSVCKDYNLYYTVGTKGGPAGCLAAPGTSWFSWRFSFSEEYGDFSLRSVGFSMNWDLETDCFDCSVSSADGGGCSSQCRGGIVAKKKSWIIGIAVAAAAVGLLVAASVLGFLLYRRKRQQQSQPSTPLIGVPSSKPSFETDPESGHSGEYSTHKFSYAELEDATEGFAASRELGDGGFSTVYKGILRDGRTVAVKRLYENNHKRAEHFANEVAILSRVRHRNLVALYGCSSRLSRDLLLVYEFVPDGTLADHLHGAAAATRPLDWPTRMTVALEAAEALAYLHAIEPPIIHRDVKTSNILLDEGARVKVADFGLSRHVPRDATHVSTAPQGTLGYLDPEYHQYYQLTDRSDVYSFGVVLMELVSSKPAVDVGRHREEINLASMAVNRVRNGELARLVDPALGFELDAETRRTTTLVAELAFRCLQVEREMRPSIKEVVEVLKGIQQSVGLSKDRPPPLSPDSVVAEIWASGSSSTITPVSSR